MEGDLLPAMPFTYLGNMYLNAASIIGYEGYERPGRSIATMIPYSQDAFPSGTIPQDARFLLRGKRECNIGARACEPT